MTTPIRPERPGVTFRKKQLDDATREQKIQTYLHRDPDYTKKGAQQHERAGRAMEDKRSKERALKRLQDALRQTGRGEYSEEDQNRAIYPRPKIDPERIA